MITKNSLKRKTNGNQVSKTWKWIKNRTWTSRVRNTTLVRTVALSKYSPRLLTQTVGLKTGTCRFSETLKHPRQADVWTVSTLFSTVPIWPPLMLPIWVPETDYNAEFIYMVYKVVTVHHLKWGGDRFEAFLFWFASRLLLNDWYRF